jgi:hypothetical protein
MKIAAVLLVCLGAVSSPAWPHYPLPVVLNPGACGDTLPDLQNSWAVFGDLAASGQADRICVSASAGDEIKAALVIPAKAVYQGPNDVTMVLVGPGLDAPSIAVPGGLTQGEGAKFAATDPQEGPFPLRNFLGNWYGPKLDETVAVSGNFEIRVFSPTNWRGEYILTTTGDDPDSASSNLQDTPLPVPGDLDGSGKVTVEDAVSAIQVALGASRIPNTFTLTAGDVAPPGDPDRFLLPGDGVIDIGDAVRILRRVAGLDNSLDWPDDTPSG